MVLVSQSYGYDITKEKALSQAKYDLYTTTYGEGSKYKNDSTDTGTYVFGNYTDSGVTSDGTKYPYMNITPDTFNKYYVGDFDLSKATLYKFYSDNPYDYRPDLYYKWYTKLFYDTYGYAVDSKTYEDAESGVTIYGDKVMQDTTFAISSDATLTTTYNKRTITNTNGVTTEKETGEYVGKTH